jgi:hypothetical protein
MAQRRVLDAIALAAWKKGHPVSSLLGDQARFVASFPAGCACVQFVVAVIVAICNGIEAINQAIMCRWG